MFSFLSKTNKSAAGSFQRNKNTGESQFKEVNIIGLYTSIYLKIWLLFQRNLKTTDILFRYSINSKVETGGSEFFMYDLNMEISNLLIIDQHSESWSTLQCDCIVHVVHKMIMAVVQFL